MTRNWVSTAPKSFLALVAAAIVSSGAAAQTLYVYPSRGQSQEQTDRDRYECHNWAVSQSGFDPTRATPPAQAPAAYPPGAYPQAAYPPPAYPPPANTQSSNTSSALTGAAVQALGGALGGGGVGGAANALVGGLTHPQQPQGGAYPYGAQNYPYGAQQPPYGAQNYPYGAQTSPYGTQTYPYAAASPYAAQNTSPYATQMEGYNRAQKTCLEGRGYTVN